MDLTLSGITTKGRPLTFNSPLELRYDADLAVPCDALDVTVPLQQEGTAFRELSAAIGGKLLFDGIVDRQTTEKSGSGRLLRLECRSKAALLLDNEVKPYVYFRLTSGQLLERYAYPYGVAGAEFPYQGKLDLMQVKKGASCWQVIEDFCRQVYRKTPCLDRRRYLVLDPLTGRTHVLSNRLTNPQAGRADGRYTSIIIRQKNDKLLSRLYVKTATEVGGYYYGMVLDDPETIAAGFYRERYYHPTGKTSGMVDDEARRILRDARQESFSVEVLLPGLFPAEPGDGVLLPEEQLSERLTITGLSYRIGAGGISTRLTLGEHVGE